MAIAQPPQIPFFECSSDEGEGQYDLGFAGFLTAGISDSMRSAGWTERRLAVLQSLMEGEAHATISNRLHVKIFLNKPSSSLFPEASIAAMLMGQDHGK